MARLSAAGGERAAAARTLYGRRMAPLIKRASVLSANYRSLAAFLSILIGAPLLFLLYELVALNLALGWLVLAGARANRDLVQALAHLEADAPDKPKAPSPG
jgi:hypothetical protein